jgi:two-component system, NarL family, sensor histidine kinase BarA
MLDVPIELARLIPPAELDELVDAICRALGGEIAIYDRAGRLLAGTDLADPRQPLDHDGERIGALAATGPNAAAALDLIATQLGLLVHHANSRELAAATHEEAMRMTFAELTEHNQRLQRALARLEELDRLKSNFLATMSHELRTPLTSVIGYAEMMAEGLAGPITGEQHDYLVTILSKADQLLGMITAVLDVASLDSAPLALERSALSLAEVVAAEVATYVPQAAKRGISIQVDYRGECTVLADKKKMRQIVSSLVSNAARRSSWSSPIPASASLAIRSRRSSSRSSRSIRRRRVRSAAPASASRSRRRTSRPTAVGSGSIRRRGRARRSSRASHSTRQSPSASERRR